LEFDVWVRSTEDGLVFSLLEDEEAQRGMEKTIAPDFVVRLNNVYFSTVYHVRSMIHLTMSFDKAQADFAATWLYEKLNGRAAKLEIDQRKVEIDQADIKRLFREKIRSET
jgi:hypothetical protein